MRNNGVIAFCGSKGAGKSTSSVLFNTVARLETEEIAIAGHLKTSCAEAFLLSMNLFLDPTLKEVELENFIVLDKANIESVLTLFDIKDFNYNSHVRPHIGRIIRTPRGLLQYIGTEVLHPIDPLIHAKIAIKNKNPNKLTTITDLRFVEEFNFFKTQLGDNFTPVYVKNSKAEIAASVDPHPSERQLALFKNKCYLLDNEHSIDLLKVGITKLIAEVFNEQT